MDFGYFGHDICGFVACGSFLVSLDKFSCLIITFHFFILVKLFLFILILARVGYAVFQIEKIKLLKV